MRFVRERSVVATLAIALFAPFAAGSVYALDSAPARLEDVSLTAEGDATVVRLRTSSPRRCHARFIGMPDRLVLDFENTTYAWRTTPLVRAVGAVVQIRGGQYKPGVARVVLDLTSRVPYSVRDHGDVVVVELRAPRETYARRSPATTDGAVPAPPAEHEREGLRPDPASQTRSVVAQAATEPPLPASPTRGEPPTAPPVRPAPGESRLISLEFKDADVVNLLRILAVESGSNIVVGDDVKGKMSISLRNVPWTLALQTILEARGLQRVDRDGVMRIVSVEQLTKEREARARVEEAAVKAEVDIRTKKAEAEIKEREAQLKEHEIEKRRREQVAAAAEKIARGPLTESGVRLLYADAGDVANTLQGLLGLSATTEIRPCREEVAGFRTKEGSIRTVRIGAGGGVSGPIAEPPFSQLFGPPRPEAPPAPEAPPPTDDVVARAVSVRAHCPTNTVFLRLHTRVLERVSRLIRESLDLPSPQVKIEARMEILDRNDLFVIGVQWGGGGVLAVDNRNVIVGRGFTSDPINNPVGGGIPAAGLGSLSNPNLAIGGEGGTVIPVSAQSGLPLGGNLVNLPISALLNNAAALGGAGGIAFGIIGSKLNLNLTLEALRSQNKTFTLARPDIVTLENKQARIALGEEIPYATVSSAGTQIAFKEALLQLVVTPSVIRDAGRNKIRMVVMVENNARGATVNLGTSGAPPAIQTRRAETEVLIGDGDHLVIGGITTSVQQEELRKVPTLGDVPILGWLFKQRGAQGARRELVVFITPSVLATDPRPAPAPPFLQPPAK
jgi:type IV pilus secretin PilQ/predicted competence protein